MKDNTVSEKKLHNKERITIRIDRDILTWFRDQSPTQRGYQSRMNQALRDYIEYSKKPLEPRLSCRPICSPLLGAHLSLCS
ncbi:MAG: BrnA antitoxin family protein [Legionellales bacterium]|nr:BrnA antitoxin family protein [Legionellales bacterium]